ncbi:MAG: hypothetical protein LUQ36_04150 [Methanoregula sp.]|jgi:tetratricopeptide (TPR) repeat protein|nr:hypothetical protein [Methanoregula sp.]
MDLESQPDAVIRLKLDQLKSDFYEYIEKNSEKIDTNIPVFYGQVIATLEKALPGINDDLYDRFIDSITLRVLEKSAMSTDVSYAAKLFDYAERNKHKKTGKTLNEIVLGIILIKTEKYSEAIERLKKYRNVDAMICPALAYCYLVRALPSGGPDADEAIRGPTPNALAAREQMIEMIRLNPPVNRLREMGIGEDPGMNRIFWFMLKKAIEWFPENREFLRIGIDKASKDNRRDIKEELLGIATERFFNDMYFLRELYKLKIENRDAGGVAGVVRQMTQQFPDDPEPIYYGIKLAIMTTHADVFYRFRKLAVAKNIPRTVLALLDFGFEIMSGKKNEALACLDEVKNVFGRHHYFVTLLDYVARDIFSDDEKKARQAKKALIDSIDQYCLTLLKVEDS